MVTNEGQNFSQLILLIQSWNKQIYNTVHLSLKSCDVSSDTFLRTRELIGTEAVRSSLCLFSFNQMLHLCTLRTQTFILIVNKAKTFCLLKPLKSTHDAHVHRRHFIRTSFPLKLMTNSGCHGNNRPHPPGSHNDAAPSASSPCQKVRLFLNEETPHWLVLKDKQKK